MNSILAVSQNAGQSLQVLILLGKTESIYVGVYRPSLSRMFRSSTSLLEESIHCSMYIRAWLMLTRLVLTSVVPATLTLCHWLPALTYAPRRQRAFTLQVDRSFSMFDAKRNAPAEKPKGHIIISIPRGSLRHGSLRYLPAYRRQRMRYQFSDQCDVIIQRE